MQFVKGENDLKALVSELAKLPAETEWVEFKHNNSDPERIGKYISALANTAALLGRETAYILWGIEDGTHDILGTSFVPEAAKHKQQELIQWLKQKLDPEVNFRFHTCVYEDGRKVVVLDIEAATHSPIKFDGNEYIRVGTSLKPLTKLPKTEKALWESFNKVPFEKQIAASNLSDDEVVLLLDHSGYFELFNLPYPETRTVALEVLQSDRLLLKADNGMLNITNLGAVLFAKDLGKFEHLARKAIRLIVYTGTNRHTGSANEKVGKRGYAIGFESLISHLKVLLPNNETIGAALREEVPIYPEIAIRELIANALIHQDFTMKGTGPIIEVFKDRMEITNPGKSLVDTEKFLNYPPRSRNEILASFMRRVGICEERGSGIDKVVFQTEFYQLPAPEFIDLDNNMRAILFSKKGYKQLSMEDRIRACYWHCCLKYVEKKPMNNSTVRERFGIDEKNKATATGIINAAKNAKLIKAYDKNAGTRNLRYVPIWT